MLIQIHLILSPSKIGTIKDPLSNHNIKITNLTIKIRDVREFETASSNSITLKKMLIDSVQKFDVFEYQNTLDTPWFDEWKKVFLNNFEICDHEYIGANFGTIFVITVEDLSNVKNLISDLYTQVKQTTNIRWFQPSFFKYFVVINTKNGQDKNLINEMKVFFDELIIIHGEKNCFWLDIELNKDFNLIELNNGNSQQQDNDSSIELTNNNNQNLNDNSIINDPLSPILNNTMGDLKLDNNEDDDFFSNENVDNLNDFKKSKTKIVYNESLLLKIDTLFKELLIKALIPWSERQIKLLNDAISVRKGFRKSIFTATKQFLQMSSSTVNLRGIVQSNNITYSPESNEMQNRKLADMAMCLRLYDLAYNFYYAARKDFQSDSAWIYFAGACEAAAMASYLNNKFQKHYFDQAIQFYLDTCKSMSLATRTTLISTDIIRKIWPTEASSYFIKLTSEESSLRSALFLEQAAKCFMQTLPAKRRRAIFHYVLAGHRFNRSNLKKHALFCYLKYNAPGWRDAYEHACQTISKLYLQISSSILDDSNEQKRDYRLNGLLILRDLTSYKEIFLTEFLTELSKQNLLCLPRELFELKIPEIKLVSKESSYDDSLDKSICFVNERTTFYLSTVSIGFKLQLNDFTLLCTDQESIETSREDLTIESSFDSPTTINCWIYPKQACEFEFELYGIEFKMNNITFIQRFKESLRKNLKFKCISTLPLLNCRLCLNDNNGKEIDAFEGLSSETIDLVIDLNKNNDRLEDLTSIKLITNANLTADEASKEFKVRNQLRIFDLELNFLNRFKLNLPYLCQNKCLDFKIEYTNGRLTRSIKKNLQIYVKECLQIDHFVKNVISLRNILAYTSLNVTIPTKEQSFVLKPGCVGHFLIDKQDNCILWNSDNRNGSISIVELGIN